MSRALRYVLTSSWQSVFINMVAFQAVNLSPCAVNLSLCVDNLSLKKACKDDLSLSASELLDLDIHPYPN